jgi:hypothetical protein
MDCPDPTCDANNTATREGDQIVCSCCGKAWRVVEVPLGPAVRPECGTPSPAIDVNGVPMEGGPLGP